jgi:electron transport complex protein RnfG
MQDTTNIVAPADALLLQEPEPSSTRLIATLGVIGFLSGLILVGIYLATLPAIEAHKVAVLNQAILQVLPGATTYQTLELKAGALVAADTSQTKSQKSGATAPPKIYLGFSSAGSMVGFAIQSSEPGFGDLIVAIFGYSPAEKYVVGYQVLESKETPGLGDKIYKNEAFVASFNSLATEPLPELVKHGEKSKPNEIEAITGATISSRAVTRLVQNGINTWRPGIEKYLTEHPELLKQ